MLCHLHKDDYDGSLVLGHELLLLARSRCCQKKGGPGDHTAQAQPPWIGYACTPLKPWSMQLEHLTWAVFDNIMGLGKAPSLSGLETYNQIIRCLMGKAYKGVHTHCPACTSTSFGIEVTSARPKGSDSKRCAKPQHYSMMRDMREEFTGPYSALKEKQSVVGRDQSSAPTHPVDPNIQGMKWMKERQRSYRDTQLSFWLLLRPLMDGGEESTRQLARRLLSVQLSTPPHILPYPHL